MNSMLLRMDKYLAPGKYIDWRESVILRKAEDLATGCATDEEIARSCFLFVRDEIQHSSDFKRNPVTVKASEVLTHGTGYCYAKSHLLAALLRANHIPAGLCYQRLTIKNDVPPFCLHGLNAVFLRQYGWYRMDARGNKPGVSADFCPPEEQLAFPLVIPGECDLPEIWAEPLGVVVEVLEKFSTYSDVFDNLPDIEILSQQ